MNIHVKNVAPELEKYLATCARIRDISITALAKRLLETIAKDQLVLSILDDDSKPVEREKGKHGFRQRKAESS